MAIARKGSVKRKATGSRRKSAARAADSGGRGRTGTAALKSAVEAGLPGWELDESVSDQDAEDNAVPTDQEPSLSYLKRKFLGEQSASDSDEDLLDDQDDRTPVRVKPKRGGRSKTADVTPDGKVTIVQG